jgi:hypothetical protein
MTGGVGSHGGQLERQTPDGRGFASLNGGHVLFICILPMVAMCFFSTECDLKSLILLAFCSVCVSERKSNERGTQ